MVESERLIIVSNRLPLTLSRVRGRWEIQRSAGGLATAMNPVLQRTQGIWIGWPGDSTEVDDRERAGIIERWAVENRAIAVDLPQETARRYYEGYANQTLWPLFHQFPTRVIFAPEGWAAYVDANQRFCEAVVRHHRPGDLIWVHDYHLMLLPKLLREALPEARIGFFLHIPFPSSEVFRILPRRRELLEGLLGADLIAFHTHSHLQHFRTALLRILGMESHIGYVEVSGRAARLEALPIGITPEDFTGALKEPQVQDNFRALRRRFFGKRILLAVDRLDYTKGIPERLRSYKRLLENASHLHGKIVLIQVAVPSREGISSYRDLSRTVNELVGEINGQFGTPDWTPVVYFRRNVPRSELIALYAAAEVGWITPLRDGMNLVAKEYVACQETGNGVLVLSEFAGAAEEMGEAFAVNPYDEERTAAMLERVLALPAEERRERMLALHKRILRNNAFAWSERFIQHLREASTNRKLAADHPALLNVPEVIAHYRSAQRRLLLLNYDGTLAWYAARPDGAAPDPALLALLEMLVADPANHVAIISGRRRQDLERWFGRTAGLCLAAEHGALIRPSGAGEWQPTRPNFSADWKIGVRPILEHFIDRTPGSFLEEKEYSLVWHYRMADPEFGEWLANELVAMLEGMLAETELRSVRGHKIVEVKPAWLSKGDVVEHVLAAYPGSDFQFAAGDDRSDEDLFARLGEDAWTVHVGPWPTQARYWLPDPASIRALLESFAVSQSGVHSGAPV